MRGHTKGPWRLHAGFGDYRVDAADGTRIVRMTASARKIEDARLIAAAPDLLAACEAALKPIDYDCSNYEQMALRDVLRAALLRARGGDR